ncbi:L-cystine transporter [Sporosarcina pasteurii]|uniref:L-cystine uptake protein TcyP n=1 Tax=Sporosarcina pasteurii TaxID=1474 RepID=A0A380CIQ8_SPOPA|nr:L-cystine transporter [Sporosarcina pasteurii]MDS9472164.1 L-cystine transporter [Sporosarcina pasteurii]QBQ06876.1 L-cystine transporter [Sporosarcina pasteurii]SUJ20291.1 Transporter of cystine tcyP [Sporosarcina pasteurii]
MNTFLLLVNIIGLLVLIGVLYVMHRKKVSFSKRVFTGLGLGIGFGLILQFAYGPHSEVLLASVPWFNLVGVGYVKLLQMIVMPLVFISILAAFTKVTIGKNFGKMAGSILGILIGTTAIAAVIGISITLLFGLDASEIVQGEAELARGASIEERSEGVVDRALPEQILDLLPANPFLDFTGARSTSTIGVVIFAAFLGFAYLTVNRKEPESAAIVKKGIDAVYALIMGVVRIVLRLTPYGVLAIIARTVATSDFGAIYSLGKFVLASYVALGIMFVVHLIIITISGLNPLTYVKKAGAALLFAFTSRSSAGTLPLNINTQTNRLGVPDGIANFAGSFGLSIGQNGCAGIYPAMLAVMIAPTVGQPIDAQFIITLIVIVAISSFGVAGVGGGATFAAILVLSALNLPIALAGLLISVEPLIDMGRTAVNVSGSMTAGVTTAKASGELDTEIYNGAVEEQTVEA